MKDERHTGVGDGLMKAQWLMCCMPHTTLHSTPSTFWSTPFFTHRERQKSGVVKGEEKGRVVVVWCGQSDGMSKPCKTQPTHNTTHKPHMPPTPSITHPQHQQVHPHSPFLLCVCCVRHVTCTVWWLALSNTLPCCAPSSRLFSFCPSLFHHHHLKNTGSIEKREGERSG